MDIQEFNKHLDKLVCDCAASAKEIAAALVRRAVQLDRQVLGRAVQVVQEVRPLRPRKAPSEQRALEIETEPPPSGPPDAPPPGPDPLPQGGKG